MRFELKEGRERKREKETRKLGTTELIRRETRHRFFEGGTTSQLEEFEKINYPENVHSSLSEIKIPFHK